MAIADTIENVGIATTLGPLSKPLDTTGKGVGKLMKLFAENVGDSLHQFPPLKATDNPIWGYTGTVPEPQLQQAYVADPGVVPTTEEAAALATEAAQRDNEMEKTMTELNKTITEESAEPEDKTEQKAEGLVEKLSKIEEERRQAGVLYSNKPRIIIRKTKFTPTRPATTTPAATNATTTNVPATNVPATNTTTTSATVTNGTTAQTQNQVSSKPIPQTLNTIPF